jgi:hypothetical protein
MKPLIPYFLIFYLFGCLFGSYKIIMEGIIGPDRRAIIIASIVVGFNFENRFQDYHAVDFLGHFDDSNIPVNVDDQRIIA